MKLKTYYAYTMAEALAAVKRDLGDDAVILHTRSFRRGGLLGFFRKTIVEVTATPAATHPPSKHATPQPSKVKLKSVQAQRAYGGLTAAANNQRSEVGGQRSEAGSQRSEVRGQRSDVGGQISGKRAASEGETINVAHQPLTPDDDRHRTRRLAMAMEEASKRKPAPAAIPSTALTEQKPDAPPRRHVLAAAPPPAPGRTARRFILTSPDQTKRNKSLAPDSDSLPVLDRNADVARGADKNSLNGSGVSAVNAAANPPSPLADQMQDELSAIKNMVGQVLQRQVVSSGAPSPMMPQQLFDLYLKLMAQDISSELADQIVNEVRAAHSDQELENEDVVRSAVRKRLAEFIPVSSDALPYAPADGRPLIIAMVGPTGVGKTTTLAKLAATFKLNHGKSVGLITADTYRIAAVDQLRTYAEILGIPMHVALTPAEMKRAVQTLCDREVILIDTAGRSQRDLNRISELQRFIAAANPHEVHLVLSSTAGEKVLLQEAQAFSEVGVHKIVLTKLDEAVTFGVLVNAIRQIGKQLSYVTTGQEVPDHIEVGSAERLADLVLGAEETAKSRQVEKSTGWQVEKAMSRRDESTIFAAEQMDEATSVEESGDIFRSGVTA